MALGTPTLVTPPVAVASSSIATAPFIPTAAALLVVHCGARASVLPGVPTISGTGGLTWTQLSNATDGLFDTGSGVRHRALAWAAVAGSATSQTITCACTGAGRMALMVMQVTGQGGIPSNAKAASDVSGSPTITLPSAPAASSVVLAFLTGASTTSGVTPPAGFTEPVGGDGTDGLGISWQCCYDLVSPPTSVVYSTAYNTSVGIAVEVTEAVTTGAGRVLIPPSRRTAHMTIR